MPTLTFRSRVDSWVLAALLAGPAIVLFSLLTNWPRQPADMFFTGMGVLLGGVLPIWLLTTTRYVLTADTLRITSGPARWTIPIADIKSVSPSRSILSSPALSLRRLEIHYGVHRSVLISPADEGAFIRALDERRRAAGAPGVGTARDTP